MPVKTRNSGLKPARIAFVLEAPGKDEERCEQAWLNNNHEVIRTYGGRRGPLVGSSGEEFDAWLAEIGVPRAEVFITNVCKYRPEDNDIDNFFKYSKKTKKAKYTPEIVEGLKDLRDELDYVKPDLVIPTGNLSLWALTGNFGITSWRGSILSRASHAGGLHPFAARGFKVIPTYHPAAVLRKWDWRNLALHDLRRGMTELERGWEVKPPPYRYIIRPTFEKVLETLDFLKFRASQAELPLAVDLETKGGHIACIGLGWSILDAISIPFLDITKPERSYWTPAQEAEIVTRIRALLCHTNVRIIGQNFIYDVQYLAKEWGIAPPVHFDTMIAQHVSFPGVPKGLDFLSSIYCDFHRYWKDEGKEFDADIHNYDQYWTYNCQDCSATFECYEALKNVLTQLNRWEQFRFQMYDLFPEVRGMVFRGVGFDTKLRGELASDISQHIADRQGLVNTLVGRPFNIRSHPQMKELFLQEFGQKPVLHMKTGNPTFDEDALLVYAKREPLLRKLCHAMNEFRSLNSAMTVVMMGLDADGQMRTSYNIAGPETFRFSSSENAFGGGGNLQNITEGKTSEETGLTLPNLRRLVIPPTGEGILDGDLQKADLYVVVWEAEDAPLKLALSRGLDLHLVNARDVYRLDIPDDELIDGTEVCEEHKKRYPTQRRNCKNGIHATNYGARPPKLAKLLGSTVHEADAFQRKWFDTHPGFKRWHTRVMSQITESRSVTSKFNYTRHFFDRIEDCFTNALAWVPQNTVAIYINKIIVSMRVMKPRVLVRLQTHDSLTATFKQVLYPNIVREIHSHTSVVVPYDDPLIIPMGFKYSTKSWGDCKNVGNIALG